MVPSLSVDMTISSWLDGDDWNVGAFGHRRIVGVPTRLALVTLGSDGIGQIAPGDRGCLVAADAVGEEGHRRPQVGVTPANGGTEATMPKGARRARGAGPVAARVGQPAQLKAEP